MIKVANLTLTYPNGKGIHNLNFEVKKGEVVGFLGPNGAGKTTTIRNLLGFTHADSDACSINNIDCFSGREKIMKNLGYIPGEISLNTDMNCKEFLKYMCDLHFVKDYKKMNELIEYFELDTNGKINKFSKGMKQKVAIITAFMHDPDIIILDEPTSGLDPIMQNKFIELIVSEKKKGKTILISSHMFEEIERTCDRVIIIKDGYIVSKSDIKTLKSNRRKAFNIKTLDEKLFTSLNLEHESTGDNEYLVYIKDQDINDFIKKLSSITIEHLEERPQTLEEIFLEFYKVEEK